MNGYNSEERFVLEKSMDNQFAEMKEIIEKVEIVSFDIFDTLIRRIVNDPETVFDIVGKQFDILNFREIRQKNQALASQKVEREKRIPHADINEIYGYIAEQEQREIDWEIVKQTELEVETDCLVCNEEMKQIYQYAKQTGKRVIITSDMYLLKGQIERILQKCGYVDYDALYLSSEVHATKYNGDIFGFVCEKEKVAPENILHIGDNEISDVKNAQKYGLKAIHYKPAKMPKNRRSANISPVDIGTAEHVVGREEDFWYQLGAYVGGPLYLGLYDWLKKQIEEIGYKKVYFLARDGYNMHQIFSEKKNFDVEYLYMSRRAVLLAGIDKVDEEALAILPPFTFGQTVREVLEYLGVEEECGKNLEAAGISSLEYVIKDVEDMQKVKKLYVLNEDAFLKKCEEERENAYKYFESIGFFEQNSIVFDCGWNGSSQYLMERFLKCVNYDKQDYFLYVGILDNVKSRKQLKNKMYRTYLFNYSNNRAVQERVKEAIVLFELFFGAPEESVYKYDEEGVVLEQTGIDNSYKKELCRGISKFVECADSFVQKYNIEISKDNAIAGIIRLVNNPTLEEAKTIGDLKNVDGFANQKGVEKYIAKLDKETYDKNPNIEIYWVQGLLARDDIDEKLKQEIARKQGISYTNQKTKENIFQKNDKREKYLKKYAKQETDEYSCWIAENEKNIYETEELEYNPLFSFVVPVYNVVDEQLVACIESIRNQTYANWELWLVDDASQWENVRKTLGKYEKYEKINVHYRKENGHISRATNDGIERANGEFIAFMDCDDVIAPNALYEFAKKLNENSELDFIYSDEDKLSEDGTKRHSPFFKPDWSPDTFMSLMYTNHLAVYRTSIVRQTGGLRTEFNGTQDYDFTLRFMELSDNHKVGHIQKVLYYWRERGESIASNAEAKPYALEAMKRAKEEALSRRGLKGHIEYVGDMYQYRVVYENEKQEKVSIIIPSKDNIELLFQCITSIRKYTQYSNYEIVVVDNGSDEENREKISQFAKKNHVIYHYEKMEFNFSRMCNLGAKIATGDYLLFLNDDIEIINGEWLSRMVGHASLPHIGAVGAKLLYPDSNIIQHIGITNLGIGPSHSFIGFSDGVSYYFGRNRMDYNVLAVTAACVIVSRDKFQEVEGFDEQLTVAYNDVDLCFKLYEAGYYNVIRNDVSMYHYESASRGSDDIDEEKRQRLQKERNRLYSKHEKLEGKDPFYNKNLTQNKVNFMLNVDEMDTGVNNKKGRLKYSKIKESSFNVVIDEIRHEDVISIKGWLYWKNEFLTNNCQVYLALKDKYGYCIYFDVTREVRQDVADALENNAVNAGFCCKISYNDIRINEDEYQIGVLVTPPMFHIRRICWTEAWVGKVTEEFYKKKISIEPWQITEGDYEATKYICNIEVFEKETGVVKGWALNLKSMENDYEDFCLIYDFEGEKYAVNVIRRRRMDVATIYGSMPNVSWSGFEGIMPVEQVKDLTVDNIWIMNADRA